MESKDSTCGAPGRRSVEDRRLAVLQVLSGKSIVDKVAHRLGVHPETVEKWRDLARCAAREFLMTDRQTSRGTPTVKQPCQVFDLTRQEPSKARGPSR